MTDESIYNLAKKALLKGDECLMDFMDSLPQMAWTGSPSGKILYFNKGWYAYTCMPPGSTNGWLKIVHPEDSFHVIESWNKSLQAGDYHVECRLRNGADGSYKWFLEQAMPLRDENGKVVIWVGTYTDIDEEKQSEEP
ncbi:PAS domain-containing protein [Pontibacter sp. H249]|uniref:PAS domain-containing protein n=1 Tax=Pontibacter sp. H249 TaxID=3133420 RepID=UPI0030C17B7C